MKYRIKLAEGLTEAFEGQSEGDFVSLKVYDQTKLYHRSDLVTSGGDPFVRSAKLELPMFNAIPEIEDRKLLAKYLTDAADILQKEVVGAFNAHKSAWLSGEGKSSFKPEDFQWTFQHYYGSQLVGFLARLQANTEYPDRVKVSASEDDKDIPFTGKDFHRATYLLNSIAPYRDNEDSIVQAGSKLTELVALLKDIAKRFVAAPNPNTAVEGFEFSDDALIKEVRALKKGECLLVKHPDGAVIVAHVKKDVAKAGYVVYDSRLGECGAEIKTFASFCKPLVKLGISMSGVIAALALAMEQGKEVETRQAAASAVVDPSVKKFLESISDEEYARIQESTGTPRADVVMSGLKKAMIEKYAIPIAVLEQAEGMIQSGQPDKVVADMMSKNKVPTGEALYYVQRLRKKFSK